MSSVEQIFRRAVQRQRDGDPAGAAEAYRRVLQLAPRNTRARNNLALALLTIGRFQEGFAHYEVRFTRDEKPVPRPAMPFPPWQGEDVARRKLLIWAEQGFGDVILFARFIQVLAHRGASVTFFVQPQLVRLLSALPATILPNEGETRVTRHDFWTMSGSLPFHLGLADAEMPPGPYLPSSGRSGGGVGLVAQGRPFPPGRSLSDAHRDRLLALPGVRSLAPEATGAADFEDTRRILDELDLVVTVDTAVANLAGAMGKPTLVLLSHTADWRWGQGETTPWYPSVRIVRQRRPGDWAPAIEAAARAIAEATGG